MNSPVSLKNMPFLHFSVPGKTDETVVHADFFLFKRVNKLIYNKMFLFGCQPWIPLASIFRQLEILTDKGLAG